jgi:hypothetical protein
MMQKKLEAWELLFQFSEKEISIHQVRAQLKDLGWTDDEVDSALDGEEDDE